MNKYFALLIFLLAISCTTKEIFLDSAEQKMDGSNQFNGSQSDSVFTLVGSIDLGPAGAAEISDYDPLTKKLFVVNNTNNNNRIDVLDLSNPSLPILLSSIAIAPYGGLVNSVSVHSGKVAAGIEASDKVSPGKVVIFNTSTHAVIKQVTVGSLPDMVVFSPNGKYIMSANEGEPNSNYSIDPIGSVSIIDVDADYQATTLDFGKFRYDRHVLYPKGLRVFGPKASFEQDMEPEYITISSDSRFAWVTLQENNAITKINIKGKVITDLFPLRFKNHNFDVNAIDASDQDGGINMRRYPVKGMYEPDGIAVYDVNGSPYLFTANEGDAREYATYTENVRMGSIAYKLDPSFPFASELKSNTMLGRLNVSQALGDVDNDGDFDEIYTHGARSFSIWNGRTGDRIFDSQNELEKQAIIAGKYPDSRSDDKGVEPETVTIGKIGDQNLLFVGMERANAVAVYNINNPFKPVFVQWLNTAIGPEGMIFVPSSQSPSGKNLLIVSCETDGVVMIFESGAAKTTL